MEKLKRSNCVVFPLVLTGKWYRMISSGEKTEEYRDITPRYNARFKNFRIKCMDRDVDVHGHGYLRPKQNRGPAMPDAVVAFSLGYTKPDMFFTIKFSLATGDPPEELSFDEVDAMEYFSPGAIRYYAIHPDWGEPRTEHYVIKLADRVELVD